MAALSSMLCAVSSMSLVHNPLIRRFLRGATNLRLPVVHRYPSWDLPLVLQAFTGPPFEPLRESSLMYLSQKVVFLVVITSARRISELAALSCRQSRLESRSVIHPEGEF